MSYIKLEKKQGVLLLEFRLLLSKVKSNKFCSDKWGCEVAGGFSLSKVNEIKIALLQNNQHKLFAFFGV